MHFNAIFIGISPLLIVQNTILCLILFITVSVVINFAIKLFILVSKSPKSKKAKLKEKII